MSIVVNEIFGPTIQGEGPSAGRQCAFLRLGGCNLSCHWCDTPYTWDWKGTSDEGIAYDPKKELHNREAEDVLAELIGLDVKLVVISGGEPLSQQRRLRPLLKGLREAGVTVEFETNGTVVPDDETITPGVRFNVSPKLSHAGDPESRRIVPEALLKLTGTPDVAFKFVCRNGSDLDEVAAIQKEFGINPIWIMPEGKSVDSVSQHLSSLVDEVVLRGWNLSTRLHVLAWGEKRGV